MGLCPMRPNSESSPRLRPFRSRFCHQLILHVRKTHYHIIQVWIQPSQDLQSANLKLSCRMIPNQEVPEVLTIQSLIYFLSHRLPAPLSTNQTPKPILESRTGELFPTEQITSQTRCAIWIALCHARQEM